MFQQFMFPFSDFDFLNMNGDDVGKYNSARFKNWKNKGLYSHLLQLSDFLVPLRNSLIVHMKFFLTTTEDLFYLNNREYGYKL